MENKNKITDNFKSVLKGNTMIFILVGVMILFEILIRSFGHGSLFLCLYRAYCKMRSPSAF